jgi:tetratricopeptide (TPR) repeat protein
MEQYKEIDDKIQKGYELILENDRLGGCDKWLEAWAGIKELFAEGVAKDIFELDARYNWTELIFNYVQEMKLELHNAGLEDVRYHRSRAVFCRELLRWCVADDQLTRNIRRGMAEGYFYSGDIETGDRLFAELLREDPDNGWGYVGWSDCYWVGPVEKRYEIAEGILLKGYARSELQDRIAVVDRLRDVYKEWGKADKAQEFEKIFADLWRDEPQRFLYRRPAPIKSKKVGRNDPCPCGSGKKYKKCCSALQ